MLRSAGLAAFLVASGKFSGRVRSIDQIYRCQPQITVFQGNQINIYVYILPLSGQISQMKQKQEKASKDNFLRKQQSEPLLDVSYFFAALLCTRLCAANKQRSLLTRVIWRKGHTIAFLSFFREVYCCSFSPNLNLRRFVEDLQAM